MPLTRQKKAEIIGKVVDGVKHAESLVFVKFHGLSVIDANEMRRNLREKGINYTVVKKTLLKRALEEMNIGGDAPELPGEIAIAYGADVVEPAKTIALFKKKFKEALDIVGGILEGRFINKEGAVALSLIPSRQMLLAQLAVVLNAPIQNTAGVLNTVVSSLPIALNQIAQKKN